MRILWLKTELLHPVDKGGKIRTYNMLKELKRDHHITYLTLDDGRADREARTRVSEYCHELVCVPHRTREKFTAGFYTELALNLVSPLPYAIRKYHSAEMRRAIRDRAASSSFDVLVCDFLAPAGNVPSDLAVPSILFQHNVEAMIWKRHYEVQENIFKKIFLRQQWRKMRAFEREASRQFDCVVAVSREDKDMMRLEYGLENVEDVPTGVDVEFFRPDQKQHREPRNLVFTGSMDWLPNEDAIRYFTEQIMPLIKQSLPDVTLTVVGRNPYPGLLELSKRDPSILVTGRVDDVRPFIDRATAYVVPLRIGGGTRLKIYEAMAMEKPIISTTVGAEGLPITDGVELLLADSAEAFAESVIKVLTDESLAYSLAQQAASRVRTSFGWNKVADVFAGICALALAPQREATNSRAALNTKTEAAV